MALKRFSQLLSIGLALCLALAGAVGFSPVLHQLVEHGGTGAAHVHFAGGPAATSEPALHAHSRIPTPAAHPAVKLRSSEALTGAPDCLHRLARTPRGQPPSDAPGHEHHSLVQLLAGGLVDCAVEIPAVPRPPGQSAVVSISFRSCLTVADWNAQTAPRGPPVLRG